MTFLTYRHKQGDTTTHGEGKTKIKRIGLISAVGEHNTYKLATYATQHDFFRKIFKMQYL